MLSGPIWPIAFLVLLTMTPLLSSSHEESTPVGVELLIFGIPSSIIEGHLGEVHRIAEIVEIEKEGEWVGGLEFVESLVGQHIDTGPAYRIGVSNGSSDSIQNIREGGIDFPLVVEYTPTRTGGDPIRAIFETSIGLASSYFALVPHFDHNGDTMGPGLISIPYGGRSGAWIGYYVLANGKMINIGGGWAPAPLQNNSRVRIDGDVFECSLVYVFIAPIPGWT